MSGNFDPIRDLIKSVADEDRGWRPAVVEDTSRWSDTGPAFIAARFAGQLGQNIAYRDGREPLIGETLWISKVDAGHAPYVALPLPAAPDVVIVRPTTCVDAVFYVVGRNVEAGGYRILRFASLSGIGDTWTDISACPAAAIGDEEPQLYAAFYSDQYDWSTYCGFPDGVGSLDPASFHYRYFCYTRGGELFYSDDLCVTWMGTGLTIRHYGGHYNSLVYACSSTALHISRDFGATWIEVADSAPPQGEWLFVNPPSQKTSMNDFEGNAQNFRTSEGSEFIRGANPNPDYRYRETIGLMSTAGFYATINLFHHYAYPLVADPPFDAIDAGASGIVFGDGIRPWHDLGSDDAHWTDTGGFTSNYPLVIDKEYRDWYGPFGAAADAQHFYAGQTGLDFGSGGATLFDDGHVRGFGLPDRGSLEARTDPYDGSIKGTPTDLWDWSYLLDSPSHLNYGVCFDTNPDFGGVAMSAQPDSASYLDTALWACNYNHPHSLTGFGLLDQANWQGGEFPFFRGCNLVGIADETEGADHCSFAIWSDYFGTTFSGTTPHGVTVNSSRSLDASVTMRHDLGAYYVTTHHGIAPFNLGWWY